MRLLCIENNFGSDDYSPPPSWAKMACLGRFDFPPGGGVRWHVRAAKRLCTATFPTGGWDCRLTCVTPLLTQITWDTGNCGMVGAKSGADLPQGVVERTFALSDKSQGPWHTHPFDSLNPFHIFNPLDTFQIQTLPILLLGT